MAWPPAEYLGFTPARIALLISGIALVFVVLRWRRNIITRSRRRAAAGAGEPSGEAHGELKVHEVATELRALLAELEETARRVSAQIDNRYARLEQLLAEADARIRTLEETLGPRRRPGGEDSIAVVSEAQRTLERLRQERGAPPAAEDPAYQPIYSLADRGKTPREIAQELGRQPGEIELILALRPRQNAR